MNNLPTNPEGPDELDRLLSDFFKAQLKQPWPNAPVPAPASSSPATEPSALAHARASESPRNAPARRDSTARARLTLAASVALALGACWVLSNGFEPTSPTNGTPTSPTSPGLLPGSGADGTDHPTLQKLQENNAKPPKIDLGSGE